MQGRYTPFEVQNIMQTMTMQVLDTTNFGDVRIDWPTQGQPAWKVSDDVAFVRATQVDDPYDQIRDMQWQQFDATHVANVSTYVRVWEINWCFVGPNSFDRAATLKSALFWPMWMLPLGGLAPLTEYGAPIRAPELFDGQWWERVDFRAKFNELVTEAPLEQTIASVEIVVEKENGIKSDFTVEGI